jgi:hypothetical protein
VAIDAQGAEMARPFVESAGATFPTVVDRNNLLSRIYGFKAIPNALFIDEGGSIRYLKYSGFDIIKREFKQVAEMWADTSKTPTEDFPQKANVTDSQSSHIEAVRLFDRGMKLYGRGQVEEALTLWRKGVALEPDNYVIRKQIWAVEHPDKFYYGDVDYDWQEEQLAKGL